VEGSRTRSFFKKRETKIAGASDSSSGGEPGSQTWAPRRPFSSATSFFIWRPRTEKRGGYIPGSHLGCEWGIKAKVWEMGGPKHSVCETFQSLLHFNTKPGSVGQQPGEREKGTSTMTVKAIPCRGIGKSAPRSFCVRGEKSFSTRDENDFGREIRDRWGKVINLGTAASAERADRQPISLADTTQRVNVRKEARAELVIVVN